MRPTELRKLAIRRLPDTDEASFTRPGVGLQDRSLQALAAQIDADCFKKKTRRRILLIGIPAAALVILAVILLILNIPNDPPPGTPGGSVTITASPAANPPAVSTALPVFRFNDLGGGSSIIQVFPGVEDTPADKLPNGTFNSGDTVHAVCQKSGRSVRSVPSAGEQERESDVWVQIIGSPGQTQYAPLTYGDMTPEALAALPVC
jgi:hypothetical protein